MKLSKQEEYNTLLQTLHFLESKIQSHEEECELLGSEVDLFRIQRWKDSGEELEYDVAQRVDEIFDELELHAVPPINGKKLKRLINEIYSSLETFYTKQIDTLNLLEKFHEEEKFNPEVELSLNENFLPQFKDATIQIRAKRREYKDKLCEMVDEI